jgi:hypothetical protein
VRNSWVEMVSGTNPKPLKELSRKSGLADPLVTASEVTVPPYPNCKVGLFDTSGTAVVAT